MILLPKNVAERIAQHEYIKALDFEVLKDNPMCPRCERVALRAEGYSEGKTAHCPACGYHGRAEVTLKEYAENEMWR